MTTPFKVTVAANWTLITSSVTEIDAKVSARRRIDIAAAEQALVTAEKLALRLSLIHI